MADVQLELVEGKASDADAVGRTLVRFNLWDGVLAAWEPAVPLEPRSSTCLFNLGIAYAQTGELDKAIETFRAAQRLNPQNQRIGRALEQALRMRGGG